MTHFNQFYDGYRIGLNMSVDMANPARSPSEALDCLNVQSRTHSGFESRKGYHWKVPDIGGYGLFNYIKKNSDGTVTEELLTVDGDLHRIKKGNFQIDYTGSENVADVQILPESGDIHLKVNEAEVELLDHDAGTGFDEASVNTLANLKTAIDALTDFSATNTASTTLPTAFLAPTKDIVIDANGNALLPYYYSEQVKSPYTFKGTKPFQSLLDNRDLSTSFNANAVNHKNVMYFAFGGALMKYDGQNVYRAGLPDPAAMADPLLTGSGSLTGTYIYSISYIYTDNQDNTVESKIGDDLTVVTDSSNVTLHLPTVRDTSGYNTKCAVAVGAQTAAAASSLVTLNVDDSKTGKHSLEAGDTAYLFNRHSSVNDYKTYTVNSATISTIVLSTDDTIQVNDNDVISANLRIAIYRTDAGGNTANKSLVAEVANDSFNDTQPYTDSTTDANLGAAFLGQSKTYGPPPTCSYVTVYKSTLVLADGYTLYYSDQGNVWNSSETFPSTDNSEEVYTHRGGIIRGLGLSGDTLCLFTSNSIVGIVGDLVTDQYVVYNISDHIGCVSHSSIVSAGSGLFFLSNGGIYQIIGGQLSNTDSKGFPVPESRGIDPVFRRDLIDTKHTFVFRRATSINDIKNSRLLFFIPAESTSIHLYANNHSRLLVYEYDTQRWFVWDNVNMAGGAAIYEDDLWFQERSKGLGLNYKIAKFSNTDRASDYWDHATAITKTYTTGWDTLGDNTTYKKPLWFKGYFRRINPSDVEATFSPVIEIEQDYIDGNKIASATITLGNVGMLWGDPWGTEYGGHVEHEAKFKIRARKSRAIRVKFKNSDGGTPFFVSAWEITYALPYERTMKE